MNKLNKILKAGVFAAFLAAVIAGPVMAADYSCITGGTGKYPNLSTSGGAGTEYPNKCVTINDGGNYITIYGKDAAHVHRQVLSLVIQMLVIAKI